LFDPVVENVIFDKAPHVDCFSVVAEFNIVHKKVVESDHSHKDEKWIHTEPEEGLDDVVLDQFLVQDIHENET
jgi:hypothetical protein